MGLDMSIYGVTQSIEENVDFMVNIDPDGDDIKTELAYWRKNFALHKWFENLYRLKGGKTDTFILTTLKLTKDDINQLEADIQNDNLPVVDQVRDDYTKNGELYYIKKVKKYFKIYNTIYYMAH